MDGREGEGQRRDDWDLKDRQKGGERRKWKRELKQGDSERGERWVRKRKRQLSYAIARVSVKCRKRPVACIKEHIQCIPYLCMG